MAYLHEPSGSWFFGFATSQQPQDVQRLKLPIDCFARLIETAADIDDPGARMRGQVMQ